MHARDTRNVMIYISPLPTIFTRYVSQCQVSPFLSETMSFSDVLWHTIAYRVPRSRPARNNNECSSPHILLGESRPQNHINTKFNHHEPINAIGQVALEPRLYPCFKRVSANTQHPMTRAARGPSVLLLVGMPLDSVDRPTNSFSHASCTSRLSLSCIARLRPAT